MQNRHGRCLAIQIGAGELRVARFRSGAEGPELSASACVPLPEGAVRDGELLRPEPVAEALRGLLARGPFRGVRRTVFCLSGTRIRGETVSVPPVGKRRLGKLLYANLDLYFPASPADSALVWEREAAEGPELRLRLWAAPRALPAGWLRLAADCGLHPAALDYGCNCLSLAARRDPSCPDGALLLYVGREQLLLCCRQNGRALLQRVLPRRALDADALDEPGMLLDYCASLQTGAARSKLWYSADTEEGCALAQALALRCGLSPHPLRCGVEKGWELCLGAALTGRDFGQALRGSRTRVWLPPTLGAAALLVAALLCLGAPGPEAAGLEALRQETERAEALLPALRANAEAAQSARAEQAAAHEALERVAADLEAVAGALHLRSGPLERALEELRAALPSDCDLCYLGIAEAQLYVQLACPDKAGAAALLTRLRELERTELLAVSDLSQGPERTVPNFPDAADSAWSEGFAETQRRLSGDERVFFTAQLELREEAGVPS